MNQKVKNNNNNNVRDFSCCSYMMLNTLWVLLQVIMLYSDLLEVPHQFEDIQTWAGRGRGRPIAANGWGSQQKGTQKVKSLNPVLAKAFLLKSLLKFTYFSYLVEISEM